MYIGCRGRDRAEQSRAAAGEQSRPEADRQSGAEAGTVMRAEGCRCRKGNVPQHASPAMGLGKKMVYSGHRGECRRCPAGRSWCDEVL